MYTVCYVLTDSEQLLLFNEMMISISSLRYYGYTGAVQVVTDSDTYHLLSGKHADLEKYHVEMIPVAVSDEYNQMQKSRFLKTSLREYITGDYLYVDTDTVFAAALPDTISENEIAMVTDHHYEKLIPNTTAYTWALPLTQKLGKELTVGEAYFNSGIAWVRDTETVRRLYKAWHEEWIDSCRKGVPQDQPALNDINQRMGKIISYLDNHYNVQVTDGETVPFSLLGNAVIIHYNHTGRSKMFYLLTFPEIRANHYESAVIQEIIKSPKTAFIDGKIVTAECFAEMRSMNNSGQYALLRKISRHPKLFSANERIVHFLWNTKQGILKLIR